MGYFTDPKIERIILPSDKNYWVDVATDFRYGDVKQFASSDGETMDFTAQADKFLLMAIKSWNLDDGEGNILEINAENIDKIKQGDITEIINAANASVMDTDTKKNS
jgi:hypothetical protein